MTENQKLIFLDIDGVLNSFEFQSKTNDWDKGKKSQIDPVTIPLLNDIILSTKAKVVLSSTWRILYYDVLIEILKELGCVAEIIDRTPQTHYKAKKYRHCQRGMQIQEWIDNNQNIFNSSLGDKFIIIDDGEDMGHLREHLIKTSGLCGLTKENVQMAIKKLNGEPI